MTERASWEPMDFEERARAVLPPHISAYYAAAVGSGVGLDEGSVEWSAIRFRPRVLRDVGTVSVSTTILGTPVRTPVLVAPMAQQIAAHPDGEVAMGRAVAATGSLMGVSTNTGVRSPRLHVPVRSGGSRSTSPEAAVPPKGSFSARSQTAPVPYCSLST